MVKCLVNQCKYSAERTVRHYQLKYSWCNEILWRVSSGVNWLLFIELPPMFPSYSYLPYLLSASYLHGCVSSCLSYPLLPFCATSYSLSSCLSLLPFFFSCFFFSSSLAPSSVSYPLHLSLSLSRCSQYGIHNEGLCYVRSHWAVWAWSRDVEILYSSSKGAIMDKSCSPLWYKVACRTCTNVWLPTSQ